MNINSQDQVFIRATLAKLVKAEGANEIRVHDGDEWIKYGTDKAAIRAAAIMTHEIDDTVAFRIGKASFIAMNDGPYDRDTRAETIIDCNDRFTEIVGEIWE